MNKITAIRTNLVWTKKVLYRGTFRDVTLDLREARLKTLARELGSEWFEIISDVSLAHGTAAHYASAIRSLIGFGEKSRAPKNLSLSTNGEEFCALFYAWEVDLKQRYPLASRIPFQVPNTLLTLLKWRVQSGRPTGDLTTARASGSALNLLPTDQPLDEFKTSEFQALRDAAKQVVRRAERRVERGNRLANDGQDPTKGGWTLGNVLWSIKNQPLGESGLLSKLCMGSELDATVRDLIGTADPNTRKSAVMIRSLRHLCDQISPTLGDLQAYRILLLSESGWSPEELTDVRLADLEWGDGDLAITATKRRADRVRTVHFKAGRSNWTTTALVRRLLAITLPARTAFGGEAKDALFVRARGTLQGVALTQETFVSYRLTHFIAEHNLTVDAPHDIRRIRKTFKTLEGALMGTARGAAGDDHTIAVSQRYYMQTSTVKVLSARAVNGAQWQVFDKLQLGPAVLPISAHEANLVADDRGVQSLAGDVLDQTLVDAELAITSCRNLLDSPWSPAGKPCHVRPTMCFVCPNALILLDHLPRIIKFREMLESQRKNYHPEKFDQIWGATLINIESIIDAFETKQVQAAKIAAASPELSVHVPLRQQVRFQ